MHYIYALRTQCTWSSPPQLTGPKRLQESSSRVSDLFCTTTCCSRLAVGSVSSLLDRLISSRVLFFSRLRHIAWPPSGGGGVGGVTITTVELTSRTHTVGT